MKGDLKIMKKIILSNEEEANEELMWQPRTKATAATTGARGATCCAVTGVTLSKSTLELKVNETHTLKETVAPDNATDKSVRWSSNKESVATVSASGLVCAKKEGTATITVETNDGGFTASCEVTVKPATVKVTGIELENTSLIMQVNDTSFLTACVKPSNATNPKIIWTSCSPDVASVNSSGLVCAKQTGVAKITAKTEDGGFSRTCVVTVTPNIVAVTGVRISHTTLELEANESCQLTANTLPSNATNKKIDWTSSNESVATVRTSGLVCAKKAGTTIITASCEDYSATCILTVIEGGVPVTGVELSQTSLSMEVDSSYLLQAEVFPDNATNQTVTWCSCSSDVATVSEKGLIQAKTTGSVKITATTEDGNFSETCWVTIVPKGTLEQVPVESVSITSQEETYHLVKMGETLSLNATVMPAAATNKEVVWLSEDASIATVDASGVIHPRSEGEVKITATSVVGGKTAEYWVKAVPATFIEDVFIDLAYKSGNTYQFVATTVPATATGKLVWTSSDPEIMSINDNGLAIRKKDGLVTITVRAETNAEDVTDFVKEKACHENVDWWIVAIGIVAFLTGVSLAEDFLPGDSPAEALLTGTFSALVLGRLIYHFFIKDDENDNDVGDVTDKVPEDSIENDDEYEETPEEEEPEENEVIGTIVRTFEQEDIKVYVDGKDSTNGRFWGTLKNGDKVRLIEPAMNEKNALSWYVETDLIGKDGEKIKGYIDEQSVIKGTLSVEKGKPTKITPSISKEPYILSSHLESIGWRSFTENEMEDLNHCLEIFEINTPQRIIHFLAQCDIESGKGTDTLENLPEENLAEEKPYYPFIGAGYIQFTHDYNHETFADVLQDEVLKGIVAEVMQEKQNWIDAGQNPNTLEDIQPRSSLYIEEHYPWMSAGYFWKTIKNMNGQVDLAGDDSSKVTALILGKQNDSTRQDEYNTIKDALQNYLIDKCNQ